MILDLQLGQKLRIKHHWKFDVSKGSIGIITKLEKEFFNPTQIIKELEIKFGKVTIHLDNITPLKFDTYFEIFEETKKLESMKIDNFELNKIQSQKILESQKISLMKNTLEVLKNRLNYTPKFITMTTNPKGKTSFYDDFIKRNKGENMKKILIPEYVGYKGTEITLVWADGTKTKAKPQSETEDVSFLYGFLIAYYKKVHEHLSREQIQAQLTRSIYGQSMEYQLGYLMGVFEENCGLSKRKIDQFLGQYVLIIMPFEIDLKDIARTYTVDKKFLPTPYIYMQIPF